MGSREARSLGAVYMGGRRVQEPVQEEPPRPGARSSDRDSEDLAPACSPTEAHKNRKHSIALVCRLQTPTAHTVYSAGEASRVKPDGVLRRGFRLLSLLGFYVIFRVLGRTRPRTDERKSTHTPRKTLSSP